MADFDAMMSGFAPSDDAERKRQAMRVFFLGLFGAKKGRELDAVRDSGLLAMGARQLGQG